MNNICIILPYFGRFNDYFPLWLKSCEYNPWIDWYIFTDDYHEYPYPVNVKVSYCKFSDIQQKAYNLWGSDIALDTPYDLCKFKTAYHVLFQHIVVNYEYWGFCDCDLIFGDIYSMVLPAITQRYDKISWRGHFTLFLQTQDNNKMFLREMSGVHTFMDGISKGKKGYCNLFDEVGINFIFDYSQKKVYKDLMMADLKVKSYNFYCEHFSEAEEYKNEHQIFEWDKGHLYRCYLLDGKIYKEEFAYVHFLRRHMVNHVSTLNVCHYLIIPPNKFIDYQKITPEKMVSWTRKRFYWAYFKQRLSLRYIFHAFLNRLYGVQKKTPDVYPFIIK